jgi:hypothetical protein
LSSALKFGIQNMYAQLNKVCGTLTLSPRFYSAQRKTSKTI